MSNIDYVVDAHDFGTPGADKRGRNPAYPYVPVIVGSANGGLDGREQILGRAFAERVEALAYAQRTIDARRTHFRQQLCDPRYRALRESCGLPREVADL